MGSRPMEEFNAYLYGEACTHAEARTGRPCVLFHEWFFELYTVERDLYTILRICSKTDGSEVFVHPHIMHSKTYEWV